MLEKITKILQEYKDDENLEVSESTTFEELDLDSLDLTQLVMDVEDAFGVTIEMNEPIKDVAALIAVVKKADA